MSNRGTTVLTYVEQLLIVKLGPGPLQILGKLIGFLNNKYKTTPNRVNLCDSKNSNKETIENETGWKKNRIKQYFKFYFHLFVA